MDQNGKLVSVEKTCFSAFLTKIWDPDFTFVSENSQIAALDVTNNHYVNCFFREQKVLRMETKLKPKKTHIDRGKKVSPTYCG